MKLSTVILTVLLSLILVSSVSADEPVKRDKSSQRPEVTGRWEISEPTPTPKPLPIIVPDRGSSVILYNGSTIVKRSLGANCQLITITFPQVLTVGYHFDNDGYPTDRIDEEQVLYMRSCSPTRVANLDVFVKHFWDETHRGFRILKWRFTLMGPWQNVDEKYFACYVDSYIAGTNGGGQFFGMPVEYLGSSAIGDYSISTSASVLPAINCRRIETK